jgi:hypothetical protein
MKRTPLLGFVAGACLFGAAGGCGGDAGGGLALNMVDSPYPGVTEVSMDVDRIEAHVDGTWQLIGEPGIRVNLLDYQSEKLPLGEAALPDGHVNQLRMFVSDPQIVDADGTHNVDMPSAGNTGIKMNVNFDVSSAFLTTVLLDFNVEQSLVKRGNGDYLLKPVIPVVVENLAGLALGTVTDGLDPVEGTVVSAVYVAGSNYPLDTVVNTGVTDVDGAYRVWALMPGTYRFDALHTDPDTLVERSGSSGNHEITAGTETTVDNIVIS